MPSFDIEAVVADFGSQSTRIGFAGEEGPIAHLNSSAGVTYDDSTKMDVASSSSSGSSSKVGTRQFHWDTYLFRREMEIAKPICDGLVEDWELLEAMWGHANDCYLKVDMRETPVLVGEKPYNSPSARQRMAEIFFEVQSATSSLCGISLYCSPLSTIHLI
jgi:actin-like protein 6A